MKIFLQAIECSLVGMTHRESDPRDLIDEIYDFSQDGKELLYANIISKDLTPSITGGRKYEVNLLSKSGTSLNKQLVDNALVEPLESQKLHLDDIEIEESDGEKEEEEDWDEIEKEKALANGNQVNENKEDVKEEEAEVGTEKEDENRNETIINEEALFDGEEDNGFLNEVNYIKEKRGRGEKRRRI